jgi:hypothetical protein
MASAAGKDPGRPADLATRSKGKGRLNRSSMRASLRSRRKP